MLAACDVHRIIDGDSSLRECEYCGFCLHPSQLVLTDRGYTPVALIEEGDFVFSHDGLRHRVLNVLKRNYTGDLIEVTTHGSPYPIIATPDHLLFMAKVEQSWNRKRHGGHVSYLSSLQWIKAKDLNKTSSLYTSPIMEEKDIQTFSISSPWVWGSKPKELIINCDNSLMKLIGYYLAEGFVLKRKSVQSIELKHQRPSIITWSFGKNLREFLYATEVMNILVNYGLSPLISSTKYGFRVQAYSVSLASWFIDNLGTGSSEKHIPSWIKLLPKEKLVNLLDAYINGDGTRDTNHTIRASTVSSNLALDIRDIALKLGYSSGIRKNQSGQFIQGRRVNTKPVYVIGINTAEYCSSKKVGYRYWHDGKASYVMTKKIKKIPYKGLVYDLHVEESHSFTGPSCTYHNCHAYICKADLHSHRRLQAWAKTKHISLSDLKHYLGL